MRLKLTPSRLESYRLFMTEDWMTEQKLVEDLRGFKETPQMRLGSAFHELVEKGHNHSYPEYSFCKLPENEHLKQLSSTDMIHEISARRSMIIDGQEVVISTRADGAIGNKLLELKTTENSLQMNKYANSCQWRFCLWAMGLPFIEYLAVQLKQDNDQSWFVKNFDRTGNLYWCDSLMDEMKDIARGLIEFYCKHDLANHIFLKEAA